ncbi:MAG: hypothetical protein U5K70_04340 [Halodesulfurarchaeum sp.]|nr:hypothetical protein [Halodesulfurarchaeum sp.]
MRKLALAALSWPAERTPDATILAAHHFWIGLGIALYGVWHVQDDHRHREPSIVMGGILVAVMGFLLWEHHPVVGAVFSHVGLAAIALALFAGDFAARYPWVRIRRIGFLPVPVPGFRGLLLIGLLVSLDDLVSHAWECGPRSTGGSGAGQSSPSWSSCERC